MHDPIEQQRRNFIAWLTHPKKSMLSVATKAGISEAGLRQYKNGNTRDLKLENKLKIAEAYGLPIEEIFGAVKPSGHTPARTAPEESAQQTQSPHTAPVFGRAERGRLFMTTYPVGYIEVTAQMALTGDIFAVRMPNTDMMPRIRMREILLADPNDPVGAGDEAVVVDTDGEIHIMRCFENSPGRGFTGGCYADPVQKITIADANITKIARVVNILING
ncbi:helix-turn-helix domain-containing protein [Thalassospira sp. MCCC 1A01428]|uniref:helix-turn-helix domain-containing protein n=1 Tax=Thalassospira sp. MCCC 1A01428 TaxID=1470575 RepID=UPI00111C0BE3|nr:S24 family peptidase [Thalassospira sp. MCCC 1A01428]